MKYLFRVSAFFSLFVIGVHRLPAQWVQVGGPEAAVVHCITGHDSVVFAGTYLCGVFVSTDRGSDWKPLDAGLADRNVTVTSLECDSTSLLIGTSIGAFRATDNSKGWVVESAGLSGMYVTGVAGAGTYHFASTSHGVFRLAGAETSWVEVDAGLPNSPIESIAISPDSSRVLAIGTQTQGVFVSTDSGRDWSAASSGLGSLNVHVVAFDNTFPDTAAPRLYAGTDLGVFQSTDFGKTWFACNVNNSGIISIWTFLNTYGVRSIIAGAYLENGGPFESTDDGKTWISIGNKLPPNNDVFSIYTPHDSSGYIYLGLGGAGVIRSTDFGATWNATNHGLMGSVISSIAVADSGAGDPKIFVSSYYANYASHDGGRAWSAMSNVWYPTPLWNHIRSFAVDGGKVFACGDFVGMASNVYNTTDFGMDWTPTASLPSATVLAIALDSPGLLYVGTNGNGVFDSYDDGNHWFSIGLTNSDLLCLASGTTTSGGPNLLAGTTMGVYGSTDGGASWSQIGLTDSATGFAITGRGIFTGSENGVFLSRDGGKTWTAEDSGLTTRNIRSLNAIRSNVFAATDSGVFFCRSTSNGWERVNEGLSRVSINCLTMDSTWLYIGTSSQGIWKRPLVDFGIITTCPRHFVPADDSVLTVEPVSFVWDPIPGATGYELQIAYDSTFGKICVDLPSTGDTSLNVYPFLQDTAYYWRVRAYSQNDTGGWSDIRYFRTGRITSIEKGPVQPMSFSLFQNYPNPFNPTTYIGFRIEDVGFVTLKVYDVMGRRVATLVDKVEQPGSYEVQFNGSDLASGVYFYRLTAPSYSKVLKMLLLK